MSSYRPIMPQGQYNTKKPNLYRACVNADPAEYKMVEAEIMKLYREASERMKTQREKFEEWYRADIIDVARPVEIDITKARVWRAWQAAIGSVVVELPEPHEDEWHDDNFTVDEIKEAIEKAGIKHA